MKVAPGERAVPHETDEPLFGAAPLKAVDHIEHARALGLHMSRRVRIERRCADAAR
jgi:hypothetical protein